VQGFVAQPASIQLDIRHVSGDELLTTHLRASGSFSLTTKLPPERVRPGGLVVILTGTSGGRALPLQLAIVVLPAPPEGLVGRAFVSRTRSGPPIATVPAKAHEVWATFVFTTQPRAGEVPAIRWYWPNGKLLGEIKKPMESARVSSFMRGDPLLPTGVWRVELRVAGTLVKALRVPVGCTGC
jgi:hypothetical protein